MQEIGAVLADPSAASDAEACEAALTFFDALAMLDERSRETLIRMVTGPTARVMPIRLPAVGGAIVG